MVKKAVNNPVFINNPGKMYYVVTGDAASQMKPLEKTGFGKPGLIKNR